MAESMKTNTIARRERGALSSRAVHLCIGDLERILLARFSAEDALPWDKTGLSVGDPSKPLKAVAVALDPTIAAIGQAAQRGANVLVTHHPLLLNPPDLITPDAAKSVVGATVWAAVANDVAVMSFHTALDANPAGLEVLPRMLKLDQTGVLVPLEGKPERGFGALCQVRDEDEPLKLGQLAARCTAVFGRAPRVWAEDFSLRCSTVATTTGSAGDVIDACLARGVKVLVCGEAKYHAALDARQAGLALIELGHDVSELPLVAPLAQAIEQAGVSTDRIHLIDQSGNWSYPEAIRI